MRSPNVFGDASGRALSGHDRAPWQALDPPGFAGEQLGFGRGCSGQPIEQALRHDDRPADDDRRERLDLRLELELARPGPEAVGEVVGALAGDAAREPGLLAGPLLLAQPGVLAVPVVDLVGQAGVDLAPGPLDPVEGALADLGEVGAGEALDRIVGGAALERRADEPCGGIDRRADEGTLLVRARSVVEVGRGSGAAGIDLPELDELEATADDGRVPVAGRSSVDDRVLEVDEGSERRPTGRSRRSAAHRGGGGRDGPGGRGRSSPRGAGGPGRRTRRAGSPATATRSFSNAIRS